MRCIGLLYKSEKLVSALYKLIAAKHTARKVQFLAKVEAHCRSEIRVINCTH